MPDSSDDAAQPRPSPGCRCPECSGLREYMLGLTGRDYGLPPAPGHDVLHVFTAGPGVGPKCDGSMTCSCESCELARQDALERQRQAQRRQPWEPRPPRPKHSSNA